MKENNNNNINEEKKFKINLDKSVNIYKQINTPKLILYIRKYDKEIDRPIKKDIKNEIEDFFNRATKYFNSKSPVSINKTIKIDRDPSTFFSQKKLPLVKQRNKNFNENYNKKRQYLMNLKFKDLNSSKLNYEILENKDLKILFESYKCGSTRNKKIDKNYLDSNIPKDINKVLKNQNKIIMQNIKQEKDNIKLSRILSEKTSTNEINLMLNNSSISRYKNQLFEEVDRLKSKNPYDVYGDQTWMINLRCKGDEIYNKKDLTFNVGSQRNPFLSHIKVKNFKNINYSIQSGTNLTNKKYQAFIKNPFWSKNIKSHFDKFKELNKIKIKGENLYNVEYKRELSNPHKKILYDLNANPNYNKNFANEMTADCLYEQNYKEQSFKNSFINDRSFKLDKNYA